MVPQSLLPPCFLTLALTSATTIRAIVVLVVLAAGVVNRLEAAIPSSLVNSHHLSVETRAHTASDAMSVAASVVIGIDRHADDYV